jgi:hypothetical protein
VLLRQIHGLETIGGDGNYLHIVNRGQHQAGVPARFLDIICNQHP